PAPGMTEPSAYEPLRALPRLTSRARDSNFSMAMWVATSSSGKWVSGTALASLEANTALSAERSTTAQEEQNMLRAIRAPPSLERRGCAGEGSRAGLMAGGSRPSPRSFASRIWLTADAAREAHAITVTLERTNPLCRAKIRATMSASMFQAGCQLYRYA